MFGPSWRERLRLDRTPIGSGCIAQVYRGEVLRPRAGLDGDGEASEEEWVPVAVKARVRARAGR